MAEGPVRSSIDAFNRGFTRVHSRVYIASHGWLGHRWTLKPFSLLLGTTGRKSGQLRSVVLVYARDCDDFLVVASNFGGDKPPAWLLNLQEHPTATVNVGHRVVNVKADIVVPDDSRYPRLFQIANENSRKRYDRYRTLTQRPIPVVVLSPSN